MKIAFLDYYINEWHANHYPEYIRQYNEKYGTDHQICGVYAMLDRDPAGEMSTAEWCGKFHVPAYDSAEAALKDAEACMILAPDNPEVHLRQVCEAAPHIKKIFVDKPFAPSLQEAEKMFRCCDEQGVELLSCSSLRYCDQMYALQNGSAAVKKVCTTGMGKWDLYAVHQLEMIVALMQAEPTRMCIQEKDGEIAAHIFFGDREASVSVKENQAFSVFVQDEAGQEKRFKDITNNFENSTEEILRFFESGRLPFSREETLRIVRITETGKKLLAGGTEEWVDFQK